MSVDVQAILQRMLQSLPAKINRLDNVVKTLFGDRDALQHDTILTAADYNTGVFSNELAFASLQTQSLIASMCSLDTATGKYLDLIIEALLVLQRQDVVESDSLLRARARSLTRQQSISKRQTRWAIKAALAELIGDVTKVRVVEWFNSTNLYFQVRIRADLLSAQAADTAYIDQSFIDQSFIGGIALSNVVSSFLHDTISRVKAQGVDYDLLATVAGNKPLTITARIA